MYCKFVMVKIVLNCSYSNKEKTGIFNMVTLSFTHDIFIENMAIKYYLYSHW